MSRVRTVLCNCKSIKQRTEVKTENQLSSPYDLKDLSPVGSEYKDGVRDIHFVCLPEGKSFFFSVGRK